MLNSRFWRASDGNHIRWTRLITEEFYLQGDEEKKRGLKVK